MARKGHESSELEALLDNINAASKVREYYFQSSAIRYLNKNYKIHDNYYRKILDYIWFDDIII